MSAALRDTAAAVHTCTFLTTSPLMGEPLPHTKTAQRPSATSLDTFKKALMR